jgi:S-DNA-T family DNA segregation ATPase FtsK/SpoIIIE
VGGAGLRREIAGSAVALLAVFALGALLVERTVPGASCGEAARVFGPFGACLRYALTASVGLPAALLLVAATAVHALRLLGRLVLPRVRSWAVLTGGAVLILPGAVGLVVGGGAAAHPLAGVWGEFVAYTLRGALGVGGAWLVLVLAASALTAATLAWNPLRLLVGPAPAPTGALTGEAALTERPAPGRRASRLAAGAPAEPAAAPEPPPEEMPAIEPALARDAREVVVDETPADRRRRLKAGKAVVADAVELLSAEMAAEDAPLPDETLPGPELLTPAPPRNAEVNRRELDAAGAKLMQALRTFKVDGRLTGYTTGPTVTQYEVEPAAGVKVRQIATLSSDLALAMRAPSIRIVAPIPGKGAVGVEVPNASPEMVAFREMMESREYKDAWSRAALPIALGKDIEGRPVIADLAKMPHLLIAGSTGSGKSVCVNTIITSLVYRHSPSSLRFLMVDPKMVELSVYNDLPHLRHKVITDNRDAAAVLKWAVLEMQDRYAILAENGCRNVQDFNLRVRKQAALDDAGREQAARDRTLLRTPRQADVAFEDRAYKKGEMPYIVVVIDEMADLMMTVQGEVETPIAMLAQKARAIGIHLILATQRPSVNVITGLIKANFPSRIAFRVASQIDSRTIIDGAGAEMLLGNGDMLFIPPGKSEPSRLQGAYLSSEETERLMKWYRDRRDGTTAEGQAMAAAFDAEPDILEEVRARTQVDGAGDEDGGAGDGGERDKLFYEAARVCVQNQSGSTSLLQRRLNVGYGRAARIVDQLVEAGVLDEKGSSKGRDVRMSIDEVERLEEVQKLMR